MKNRKILAAAIGCMLVFAGCANNAEQVTPPEIEVTESITVTKTLPETTLYMREDVIESVSAAVETDTEVQPEQPETTVQTEVETEQSETAEQTEQTVEEERVQINSGYFDETFLQEALKGGDNFVVSSLSAKLALNMAAAGADEGSATEKELLALFGYKNADEMKTESGRLMDELNYNTDKGIIETNNSVWVSDIIRGYHTEYGDELKKIFGAESTTANLNSKAFVRKLNKWVSEKTHKLIPKLLNEPLGDDARLVLVNTLYFKNKWVYKFDKESTHDGDFYGVEKTSQVPIMHETEYFDYCEGRLLRSVELRYRDGSKMRVFLPKNEDEKVADVIGKMSPEELYAEMNGTYTNKKVRLALPKFECEYGSSLVDMLKTLGVNEAFDKYNASFGKIADITPIDRLFISDVFQAAKIICDEDGTEAAAVTLITFDTCSATPLRKNRSCSGLTVPSFTRYFPKAARACLWATSATCDEQKSEIIENT